MLGQPVYFLTPDVVGVHLTGRLREGVTATDLVLHDHRDAAQGEGRRQVRRVPRRGRGVAVGDRPRDDRATWRPSTARRWASSRSTRRPAATCARPAAPRSRSTPSARYFQAQGMFGMPRRRRDATTAPCSSSTSATVVPSVAGPKRPQDRIELPRAEGAVPRAAARSRSPRAATASRRTSSATRYRPASAPAGERAADRRRRAGLGRPLPDRASARSARTRAPSPRRR